MYQLLKISLLTILLSISTACGGEELPPTPVPTIVVNQEEIVDYFVDRYEMPNPTGLDTQLLEEYLDIDPEIVEEFYGYFSLEEGYPDCIIYVQAVKEEEEALQTQLEQRRSFLEFSLVSEQNWQFEKANKGEIFVYDQDLYLIIGGRSEVEVAKDMKEMMDYLANAYAP